MIVLDCSAAIEIARKTDKGLKLHSLLDEEGSSVAPDLFTAETVNAVWKYAHVGLASEEKCQELLGCALELPDEFCKTASYAQEALGEAMRNDHSAYDLFYVVLARRKQAKLMTLDKQLIELCEKLGVKTLTA